jgi:hypothetical protein
LRQTGITQPQAILEVGNQYDDNEDKGFNSRISNGKQEEDWLG